MRRIIIWVLLAFLGAMIFPITVGAQGPSVTMQASALYDGTSKYGEWLPVTVAVANSGDDVSGQVQVRVTTSAEETIYAQRVELPRGARKQLTIYTVPNNFSRRLQVEFVPQGADEPLLRAELTVRPVPNVRFLVAAVSSGGEGLDTLAGINFRGDAFSREEALLVPLTLDTLPDRPEALRTLDMIVLAGVDSSALTPRQQEALAQYVGAGGLLLLGGGPEASRVLAGIPDALRPVALTGEQALDALPALEQGAGEPVRVTGPFPVAVAEPVENAIVRLAQDGQPFLVEREVGRGAVLWLALDPSLSPFDAWAGADEFWQATVGGRGVFPRDMPVDVSQRQMVNEQMYYALQNLPSLDLPSLRLLAPLLAVYILIIGPVNYFLLRRLRRLELAWVTIPAITLLFSMGAYGLGYQLRGGDVIVNQVAIVQALPGSNGGYVRSVVGIFSPARRSYNLAVANESLVAPSRIQGEPWGPGGAGSTHPAVIVQGEPTLVENFVVNQWSMQSLTAESLATEGYGFDADLSASDGALVGTITNRSNFAWNDVTIILGNTFERVGDIAAGESKRISFKVDSDQSQVGGDIAWRIFEQEFNNPTGASRDVQVKQQMLSSLYNGPTGATTLASSNAPVLVAWLDGLPTQVELSDDARVTQVGTTLLYSEMVVRFGAGEVSLPRGMLGARIIENDGNYCYGPGIASLSPDFKEAQIEWEVPRAVQGIDPSLLSLYVSSDGGWFNAPDLALYNFEQEAWVEVEEPVLGQNKVTEPDVYLSPEGVIRLRIQNPTPNQGGCLFFDASLDGTLSASDMLGSTD